MMAVITIAPDPDAVPAEVDAQAIIDEGGCVWPPPGTDVEDIRKVMQEAHDRSQRRKSRSTNTAS